MSILSVLHLTDILYHVKYCFKFIFEQRLNPIFSIGKYSFSALLFFFISFTNDLKADSPVPTAVSSVYNPFSKTLTVTVSWSWNNPNDKALSVAVFADLNGDGLKPDYNDNPNSWVASNSSGNGMGFILPNPSDEFLGQLATSSIEGTAGTFGDTTDGGIASMQVGFLTSTPRVLFPYGLDDAKIPPLSGTFTVTYTNVEYAPESICVVLYDIHTGNNQTTIDDLDGQHSPVSADNDTVNRTNHNGDNSAENGQGGNVSCLDPEASDAPCILSQGMIQISQN